MFGFLKKKKKRSNIAFGDESIAIPITINYRGNDKVGEAFVMDKEVANLLANEEFIIAPAYTYNKIDKDGRVVDPVLQQLSLIPYKSYRKNH